MSQLPTEIRIEHLQFGAALGAIGLAWCLTIGLGLPEETGLSTLSRWSLALVTAAAYTGGYAYAMYRRGRIALSADPVALPAAFLAFALYLVGSTLLVGQPATFIKGVATFGVWGVAYVMGYIAMIAFMVVSEPVLKRVFRKRLAEEREARSAGA